MVANEQNEKDDGSELGEVEPLKQDDGLVADDQQQLPPSPPLTPPLPHVEVVEQEEQRQELGGVDKHNQEQYEDQEQQQQQQLPTSSSASLPAPPPQPSSLPVTSQDGSRREENGRKESPSGENVRGWSFWQPPLPKRPSRRDGDRGAGKRRAKSLKGLGGGARVISFGNEDQRRRRPCPLRSHLREKEKHHLPVSMTLDTGTYFIKCDFR